MAKPRKLNRQKFSLPKNHGWTAKPGNQIFVANKGEVRFEFPGGWILDRTSGGVGQSICIFDGHPPNDNIRLQVSVLQILDPVVYQVALADLLNHTAHDIGENCQRTEPFAMKLPQHELAWLEMEYIDPIGQRPAHSRCCLARGSGIQTYITLDYWPEDADRARTAWDDVLGTLVLGDYLESPFSPPNR